MLLRRLAVLLLLLCAGCSAQSSSTSAPPDVTQKVQRQVQAYFNIPPEVDIKLGPLTPSEFPNFDNMTVTLSHGEKSQSVQFLLSKDGKTLIRMTKMDLTKDPYAETMKEIDVAGRPVRGNPDAKVTLVNFDDFECPFCARMHSTLMSEILPQYGDKIKIIYKDYPLSMHPWAVHAANDANCLAKDSGKSYWEFADYVHGNQHAISRSSTERATGIWRVGPHHVGYRQKEWCRCQPAAGVRESPGERNREGLDGRGRLDWR